MKLAIVTTHPIQYYAPVFKLLQQRGKIDIHVFYTWGRRVSEKFDPGFGKIVDWDIPLLEGYTYSWAENIAHDAGTHHFFGINTPSLVGQISDWKPDAVLFVGWAWYGHLKAMRFFKNRLPVFFRGDSTLFSNAPLWKNMLRQPVLKWVYQQIDTAFYVGKLNRSYFEHFGLSDRQLVFAPHAIDNDRFAADHRKEASLLRAQLGVGPAECLILFAGKFEAVKNIELLVTAFTELDLDGTHLLLVGQGPLEGMLKAIGADSRSPSAIHFMKFQNQSAMPSVYQSCDLFCLPSESETWGLAVNEAMACAKPVLISDTVGCAPDLLESNVNGLVFRSGDKDHLKACLNELTLSKERLKEMGKNSYDIIKDWSFEKIAEAIEKTLNYA